MAKMFTLFHVSYKKHYNKIILYVMVTGLSGVQFGL